MKVNWLIEDKVFEPDSEEALRASIRKAGQNIILINYRPFGATNLPIDGNETEDVNIAICSLECSHYLRRRKYVPGVYHNPPMYECVNYYSHLGSYLLNGNYIMLPWAEMLRQKEFLYDKLGQDRAIFVRPNRGDKIFTGQVVYKEKYDKAIELLGFYAFDKSELIIVAEPQNLQAEWRFIVVGEKVITGSQYKKDGIVGSDPSYPNEAAKFAEQVAKEYKPDPVFVVDVCLTKAGDYRLVEVGSFSCAGLYKCDTDVIVKEVSKAACDEWIDIYGGV